MIGRRLRGLVLVDVVAIVTVCALLAALLAVSRPRERVLGQLGESMSNLREFGVAFEAYGRDNADRVATFSWKQGVTPSAYPDLKNAFDDIDAGVDQAVDIIRRRASLTQQQFPKPGTWLPHLLYSHLVLVDYLEGPALWNTAISPGDAWQLKWASDPLKWRENGASSSRQPFGSSYELPIAFSNTPDSGDGAIYQAGDSGHFITGFSVMGGRRLAQIVYPSSKALMYERFQWFFGPRLAFCLYDEARVPVLSGDGNVQLRLSGHANPGWQPNDPTSPSPTMMGYSPALKEPPALQGVSTTITGKMRWTRHALAGRDFDAAEVP